MSRRIDPWALAALGLGTVSFLSMPYSLYLFTVLAVGAWTVALLFLLASPLILTVQYLRYRRGSALPADLRLEGE